MAKMKKKNIIKKLKNRYIRRILELLEHSSNYADINKKRSEWDLNPRARKRTTAFRVLSSFVNDMVSPVIFSQPCTPANPHEIWAF